MRLDIQPENDQTKYGNRSFTHNFCINRPKMARTLLITKSFPEFCPCKISMVLSSLPSVMNSTSFHPRGFPGGTV